MGGATNSGSASFVIVVGILFWEECADESKESLKLTELRVADKKVSSTELMVSLSISKCWVAGGWGTTPFTIRLTRCGGKALGALSWRVRTWRCLNCQ